MRKNILKRIWKSAKPSFQVQQMQRRKLRNEQMQIGKRVITFLQRRLEKRWFMNNFQSLALIYLSMSETSDFEEGDFEVCVENTQEEPLSVKKYLSEAKDLMEKILFTSYKINPMFPSPFLLTPDVMKADTAQQDTNNMNSIEQSAFRHEKLKRDVIGFLLNSKAGPKPTLKKSLPSISDFYEEKVPIYERYPTNQKSKCMATYVIDSKSILKQDLQRKSKVEEQFKSKAPQVTHRTRIEFNSNFQSGNLFRVYQRQYNEYDLILQNDINTKGNNQWFFFSIKNVPKNMTLKLNIVNLAKKHSLFDQGMKPYTFSLGRFEKRKVGWVREGMKVNYEQNEQFCKQRNGKPYYRLSFQYKFSYEGDVVYFAQTIPYGVTDLSKFLASHVKEKCNIKLMRFKNLARTLGNQQIDLIQISDEENRSNKQVVWIFARQHSGEVTSSFMMEGFINTLLSKTPEAAFLLHHFVFKIVPMVNMDGVVHGNSRAEMSGADPNRKWVNPHKLRNPVIYALKKAIEKDKGNIAMVLDLHSHSRKLGTFFYGNSFRDSKMSTRKFPMMVCLNDKRFNYTSCRFSPCNSSSARHVLFQNLQIPLIYTVQSSFYGYQKEDHNIIEYLPRDYRQMGKSILDAFCQYQKMRISSGKQMLRSMIENEEEQEFEQEREKDEELDHNVASDSDPSGDQFEQTELKSILPNLFGKKKNQEKKMVKKKKKKVEPKKEEKEEIQRLEKPRRNQKQSQYRIYFSARQSVLEKRTLKELLGKKQTREFGTQASFTEPSILKGSTNIISSANLLEKRNSLMIMGQKVEQQVTILGNYVGIQADMTKQFTQNREQLRPLSRKSFKVSTRVSSILQVKENNFLNRGDCHTMPLRSMGRR